MFLAFSSKDKKRQYEHSRYSFLKRQSKNAREYKDNK